MNDILPQIQISEQTQRNWRDFCRRLIRILRRHGCDPAKLQERAYRDDDGNLVIYLDLPDGSRANYTIPPCEWRWNPNLN